MKIRDYLKTEQFRQLEKMKQCKEKVDWKEIMGMNRQTLKRGRGGAMKRKV
ncbi:hypothetical protein [Priestia flexa]|uniref:hypothetical protein n=1 Tax=Priestia flexa TaxID=86664 RepID=UPI003D03325F